MASKNDEKWMANYEALKAYIDEHHHLPDKHKETDRNKLSWWKYQMKKNKVGTLTGEQERMLQELADSRSTEHTGGRRKKVVE
ncbi:MAG: helicase associated domain-containing protein [Segatella copri]